MGIDVSNLEPAERNPAQLRKTAFIILAVAFFGGAMIMAAYLVKTRGGTDRPAIVNRLESNFAAVNQDGETVDLGQLEGGIWLVTVMALSQPEVSRDSLQLMREIEAQYSAAQVVKFVCFTVDPKNDTPEKLAAFAREQGVDSERWWFLAAGEEPVRGYVKDHLLLGTVVDQRARDGELTFPSLVGLIDQHRHLRGRYDFRQAREVAESAAKLLREEPERADEFYEDFGRRPEEFLDEREELKGLLEKAIDYILTEKLTD